MSNYFQRDYTLNIVLKGGILYTIKNLRIIFEATYTPDFGSLQGNIKVYNLSKQIRHDISRRIFDLQSGIPVNISLIAGYVNNVFNILTGSCLRISHLREGPDWITEFEVLASMQDLEFTNIEQIPIFPNGNLDGQSATNIINGIVKYTVGAVPTYTDRATSNLSSITEQHLSASGNAWLWLISYLQKYNCGISLGAYPVIYQLGGNSPDSIKSPSGLFILSSDTGLIGSPVITTIGLQCKALITPQIKSQVNIGVKALIIQEQFNLSQITVTPLSVKYSGDFRSEPWFVEFDSMYLPGSVQS